MLRNRERKKHRFTALLAAILLSAGLLLPTGAEASSYTKTPAEDALVVNVTYAGVQQPEEAFTVTLTPKDEAPEPAEGTSQQITLSDHTTTGSLNFSFVFTEEGTYTYQVSEQAGSTERVTYDTASYTVTFEVYLENMELKTVMRVTREGETASKPDGITFENNYAPAGSVVGDPPITRKVVIGTDKKDPFVFVLSPLKKENPMPAGSENGVATVTINGPGEKEFGEITFDAPGIYEYEIIEQNDKLPGYTYDESVYRVIYTITDVGKGTLTCERAILKNNYDSSRECVFTNRVSSSKSSTGSVKTGDTSGAMKYLLLLAAAVGVMLFLLALRKRRSDG